MDLAVVFEITPATARTRLHRARGRLRAVLDVVDEEERVMPHPIRRGL